MKILSTLIACANLLCATAQAVPSLVIVVRHAERAAEPKGDPALTAEGTLRAQLLSEYLADAKVSSIITTHYRRTQETALPTAKKFGITPTVIAVRKGESAAHVPEVVATVQQLTGVVLVVGHSNTVSEIVAGLSGTKPAPLCETSFSHIFVVNPQPAGSPVLHFRYGQADAAPAPDCQ